MNLRELEEYINKTAVRFLDIEPLFFDMEINKIFEHIGTFSELDRIYYYHFSDDGTFMRMQYIWCSAEIRSSRVLMQEEIAYAYPWLIRKMKRKENVVFSDILELPEDALSEKEMLFSENVKSGLFIPMANKDTVLGYLGFESVHKTMLWDQAYIAQLQILSKIIATAKQSLLTAEKMEAALYAQSLLLNYSDVQLWALKNTTVYSSVNEAHARFFGKDKQELQHQDLFDVFPPETADLLCKENWVLFEQKGAVERELWIKNCHGEDRLLRIKSRPKSDPDGNIEYLICTGEDITEQRRIENDLIKAKIEAEAANVAKSEFLANMSHEIRTPFNGVIGFLQMLSATELNEIQREFLGEIKHSSELLLDILNDILDFSKIEAGKIQLEAISFNIRSAVESAVVLASPRAYQKGLGIYTFIKPNIPDEVIGDPGRLRQVINNLISNAIKFTEKGEIIISLDMVKESPDSFDLRFEVSDTGIGISEENIKGLFTQFTQADTSTTRKYGGTGLGLAISKRLVELMNGDIAVSSSPGEGSKFSFVCTFQKSNAAPVRLAPHFDALKHLNVFLLDSDKTSQRLLRGYLEEAECIVAASDNYAQAIKDIMAADKSGAANEMIIVNLPFPDLDAYHFAETVKNLPLSKKVHLVLLISFAQKGEAGAAKIKGYDGFLTKPIRRDELLNCIALILNKSRHAKSCDPASTEKIADEMITRHSLQDMDFERKPRILIVEDNQINRKLIILMLNRNNLSCDIAVNGKEAVEACMQKEYDLVFMDCQMPVMDGYTATGKIRVNEQGKRHTTIIAMTANAMKGDKEKCLSAGMDDYMSKPVVFDALSEKIAYYLNQRDAAIGDIAAASSMAAGSTACAKENSIAVTECIQRLICETGLDYDKAEDLFNDFLTSLPETLLTLKNALEEGAFETLKKLLHQLKGAAANFRITVLLEKIKQLEQASREENKVSCTLLLDEIEETISRLNELKP